MHLYLFVTEMPIGLFVVFVFLFFIRPFNLLRLDQGE